MFLARMLRKLTTFLLLLPFRALYWLLNLVFRLVVLIFTGIGIVLGWMTGLTAQHKAEREWRTRYGEIPDGFCLVYRYNHPRGECVLKRIIDD